MYTCPVDQAARAPASTTTSYLAVVGRSAPWRWDNRANHEDHSLPEWAAGTFLVVETADSGIQWTEPKDIRFDDLQALRALAAHGPHMRDNGYFFCKTPGVNAVLVDGDMVFMFGCDGTFDVLTGLLPPNEPTARTRPDKDNPLDHLYAEELQVNWPHAIGLPVWIVAVGLLSYQVMRGRRARKA